MNTVEEREQLIWGRTRGPKLARCIEISKDQRGTWEVRSNVYQLRYHQTLEPKNATKSTDNDTDSNQDGGSGQEGINDAELYAQCLNKSDLRKCIYILNGTLLHEVGWHARLLNRASQWSYTTHQMIVTQIWKQKMDDEINESDVWHNAQCSSRPKVSNWGTIFVWRTAANAKKGPVFRLW